MSDIKMSDWFDLPTTPAKFWLAPVERDNDDRRRGQMIALTEAINSHDKLTARNAELEALIKEADEYLNTNSMTSISSGSVLHTKFKQALKDNS